MRYWMVLAVGCAVGLCAATSAVHAGPREDCDQVPDRIHRDLQIRACSEVIRRDRKAAWAYNTRGELYVRKGDYDRATADHSEAIKLFPRSGNSYASRGDAYSAKGDYDRAIADYDNAIGLDPSSLFTPQYYAGRGKAYLAKGNYDRALVDLNEAIRLSPHVSAYFAYRGEAHEGKGNRDSATEDYNKALALPVAGFEKDRRADAAKRLAALLAALSATKSPTPPVPPVVVAAPAITTAPPVVAPAPGTPPGHRVALVIGNATYRTVKALPNPAADAREVAAALRAAGFAEVVERYDLGVKDMQRALKAFEDKATGADWAVVYYAGHGIEVDGRNYLIPIDAELKSASDVEDETLPLDRVLARVSVAQRLQLVILDACRDNPFTLRMTPNSGLVRNVGTRGLGRIEPTLPNLFVAYSARHGEVALDGTGKNSPYAKALVKYLAEPGLELGVFFRRVRGDVVAETGGKQRPFEYGSLIDDLFFRPVAK